jgi:hypothetical protein
MGPVFSAFTNKANVHQGCGKQIEEKIIHIIYHVKGPGLGKDQPVYIPHRNKGHALVIEMGEGIDEGREGNQDGNDKEGAQVQGFADLNPDIFKAEKEDKQPHIRTGKVLHFATGPGDLPGRRAYFQEIADSVNRNKDGLIRQVFHVRLTPIGQDQEQYKHTKEDIETDYDLYKQVAHKL